MFVKSKPKKKKKKKKPKKKKTTKPTHTKNEKIHTRNWVGLRERKKGGKKSEKERAADGDDLVSISN